MTEISIEEQINKLRKEGKLKGKVIDIEVEVNKKEYLRFKEFCNNHKHLKEEDILACAMYDFMENFKG